MPKADPAGRQAALGLVSQPAGSAFGIIRLRFLSRLVTCLTLACAPLGSLPVFCHRVRVASATPRSRANSGWLSPYSSRTVCARAAEGPTRPAEWTESDFLRGCAFSCFSLLVGLAFS